MRPIDEENLLKTCITDFKEMYSAKSPEGYEPPNSPYQPLLLLSIISGYKGEDKKLDNLKKIPINPISESDSGLRGRYKDLKTILNLDGGPINLPLDALKNEKILGFKFNKNRLLFDIDPSIISEGVINTELRDRFENEGYPLEENLTISKHDGGYWIKSGGVNKFWIEFGKNKLYIYKGLGNQPNLSDIEEDIDHIHLVERWIDVIENHEKSVILIEKILDDERYFTKTGKERMKGRIQDMIDRPLYTEKSDKETDRTQNQKSNSDYGEKIEPDDETSLMLEDHLEKVMEESDVATEEVLELLEKSDDRYKSKLLLALEYNQDSKILDNKKFKDKVIDLIIDEEEGPVRENLKSLIHTCYDHPNFFINRLLILLDSHNPETRSDVAESLEIFDMRKVNTHLIDKLQDESIEVRLSALKTLIRNDNFKCADVEEALEDWKRNLHTLDVVSERSIEKTKKKIEHDDIERLSWRKAVKNAIKNLVDRHGDPIFTRQSLIDEEMDYIKRSTRSEGKTPTQTLSRVLQELWKEEDFITHKRRGVYEFKGDDTEKDSESEEPVDEDIDKKKEQLLAEISEGEIDLKEKEYNITELLRNREFLARFIEIVDDFDPKKKYKVINILSNFEKDIVLERLVEWLENPNEWVRENSAEALKDFSEEMVIPKLSELLKNSDFTRARKYAAEILGEFDYDEALKHLEYALEDKDPEVRKEAVNSLGKKEDEKLEGILSQAKKSDFPDVRDGIKNMIKRKDLDISEDEKKDEEDESLENLFP